MKLDAKSKWLEVTDRVLNLSILRYITVHLEYKIQSYALWSNLNA